MISIYKPFRSAAFAAMLVSCALAGANAAPVSGQGTWEATLQARDLDGDLTNGAEAWFDSSLNLTWLADGNFAATTGYESNTHGPGGNMVFGEALFFTGGLSVAGVTGWRLPKLAIGDDGTTADSELAHLFNSTLGNGDSLSNTGPFANLTSHFYWTEDQGTFKIALFNTTNGLIDAEFAFGDRPAYAWAVRDGDVGTAMPFPPVLGNPATPAIPEPGAVAMALAGLAITALTMRRKRAVAA
jgi:hypothetical protein